LLQHDLNAQIIAQPGDEKLDLLGLTEGGVTAGEGDEVFAELIDGASALQHSQLPDRIVHEGQPKMGVH
jgi:hypothetical protein